MIKKYFHNDLNRNFSIATLWICGGSDKDKDGKKGINHILCSLLMRGCEGFDNFVLSDFIESFGAELNHEVLEDGIFISIKSINSHFTKLLPLLNLIINKPILSEIQFQLVKKSTLNLIKKDKENPFNICFEEWRKIVYVKNPYAFNSMGYSKDVTSILYKDIFSEYEKFRYRKKYLISNNPKINGLNLKCFDEKSKYEFSIFPNNKKCKERRFVSSYFDSNQIIIMLGNQTCSRRSNDYLPLKILESYLSFGMTSVLFKLFREKNGITYDVGVLNSIRNKKAPFLVYLSVSNKNALLAFDLLTTLWKELLFSSISEEEVLLAKTKLKSSFLISNQSLDEILQRKIYLISLGISPNSDIDYICKIDSTTPNDIQKLMKKYFACPYLSIIGNKKICNEIEKKWMANF